MTKIYIAFLLGVAALLVASWRTKLTAAEDASTPEEKKLLAGLAAIQWSALTNGPRFFWGRYPDTQQSERISEIKRRLSEIEREREANEKPDPAP
jgi:hypothetical protein